LLCTNTDAAGFFAPISEDDWAHRDAIVVGAGGAARAILFALAQADIGTVTIMARSPLKAAALLSHFGLKGQVLQMDKPLPSADLLVNSSPLGMVGQLPLDLDLSPLPEDALVYDIVYTPIETPLLAAARQRGLATIDGLDMLIGQAAVAFELFFGQAPPDDCEDELRDLLLK
jgi:shikimate dehydrogenase